MRYFERLSLPGDNPSDAHKSALTRAHELRRFEIENYWKRSAYFWGFQLVAFGALALTAEDGRFNPPIALLVSVLGALAALTGALTARGSKFWQANWESHVDYLESAVEGNLHKTVLMDNQVSFSVSRVNERFLEVLFAGWCCALIASALTLLFPELLNLDQSTASGIHIAVSFLAFVAGVVWLTAGQKSLLQGRTYNRQTMEEWNG